MLNTLNVSKLDKVVILLSTYNGSSFLQQQLATVYNQTYPYIEILVRDDGSSDNTLALIEKEQSAGRLGILSGHGNIGPAASFLELLKKSPNEADFFAFCDQDDIWNPDKIETALAALKASSDNTPAMYFSRVEYVDAGNAFIKLSPLPGQIGFGNALVENIAAGCTIVLNRSARDLLVNSLPDACLMHDSWCYLVISCFGDVLFDERPSMRYRQHSSNAIGAAISPWDTLVKRIRRFKFNNHGVFRFSDQARKFLELFEGKIPDHNLILLLQFVKGKQSFLHRLRLSMNPSIWRQSVVDNLILRVLILLNKY